MKKIKDCGFLRAAAPPGKKMKSWRQLKRGLALLRPPAGGQAASDF